MFKVFVSRSRRALLLLLLLSAVSCRKAQTVEPESVGLSRQKLQAVHNLLEEQVQKKRIAGGVALIARHGKVAYVDPVGMQDVETAKPMARNTIFRICSMSKPITSVGVMMLVEEGRLSLSDPVSKFIPEFKKVQVAVPNPAGGGAKFIHVPAEREITIRDLLTHTSGLTYGFLGREYLAELYQKQGVSDGLIETKGTIGDNVRRLAALPLKHHPGTAWEYSLSTDVLGYVIEVASGDTLDKFFKKRIFKPLNMKSTCFRLPAKKRPRLASVYQPKADKTIEKLPEGVVKNGFTTYSASYPYGGSGKYFSGGAGLVSTVSDYSKFLQMLLNGGKLNGVRLLKRETVDQMTKDQCRGLDVWIKNHGDSFGLGFGVVTEAGKDRGMGSVGTYSWGGFYYTYFWVDPKEDLVGIWMAQLYPWGDLTLWDDFRKLTYAALEGSGRGMEVREEKAAPTP